MTNISVRIDPELKERMDKFKDLNWSAVIRNAIKETRDVGFIFFTLINIAKIKLI